MKKILVSLGVLAFTMGIAFAQLNETKTTDIDLMRRQGFSEATLRVIDTTKAKNQAPSGRYQRQFIDKNYSKPARAYLNIKNYVDPIQEDNLFGEHQVNYTNTWNGDTPGYAVRSVDTTVEENL